MTLLALSSVPLMKYLWHVATLLLCISLSSTIWAASTPNGGSQIRLDVEKPQVSVDAGSKYQESDLDAMEFITAKKHSETLSSMIGALDVMQEEYFEVWQGIWPTGIDWTSAVLGTQMSAALSSITASFDYMAVQQSASYKPEKTHENLVNRYFSQLVAYYFGQDAFRLRNEAYDDMLWVVLGWLESIKFIRVHSDLHYREPQRPLLKEYSKHSSWYGKQWIPAFAHRARLFWDLASKGWDTSLCDGGMIWSPYLTPYKNAITNELFITASIGMYLYFPGDDNPSPFPANQEPPVGPRDPKYLAAAIEAYKWLQFSNMTNEKGLYVDGFHVSGWEEHPINDTRKNTKCDARNNMVYTYNQGVLLSGQRGLWKATGAQSYLEEGHNLISNVINATGYDLRQDKPYGDGSKLDQFSSAHDEWHGIGRSGILEEVCDAAAYCSQDSQTFKGIFFHHLALFCAPLLSDDLQPGESFDVRDFQNLRSWHDHSCAKYGGWIRRNAEAAMRTRKGDGRYGMWWGAPSGNYSQFVGLEATPPDEAIDYRNQGVPKDRTWQEQDFHGGIQQHPTSDFGQATTNSVTVQESDLYDMNDANDRGRGRTVETQAGGLAVLRALWEIVDSRKLREAAYITD